MKCDPNNVEPADRELDDLLCEPVDALDEELERMANELIAGPVEDAAAVCRGRFERDTVEEGRPMAVLSYFSVMFGLPIFVLPMILRDNAFALHHAKAAGLIFVACTSMFVLALVNCAFFLPFVFLCYIPALIGLYRAAAGGEAGTAALGPTAERIFHRIEVKE